TQEEIEAVVRELNEDPECTGYIRAAHDAPPGSCAFRDGQRTILVRSFASVRRSRPRPSVR
ncbi:hypothetical protein ACFXA3_35925, partial [Streptomyces sp. NPDC059456]|uniref:hypothetical protein n=1 Tax=Streptomyces sp. NPDC059456 TaxID=3346838 RepID=UPI0036B601CB